MRMVFYLALVFVAVVSMWLFFQPKRIDVESIAVRRGRFAETFVYEGIVRARNRNTIYAMANGNITGVELKTGDRVSKGSPITRLRWDESTLLRSPIDGVVSKVFRESAGPVMRGEAIVEIIDLSRLEVIVDMLTTDAVRLSRQGKATVMNWGEPIPLSAEIRQINRSGSVKISALGVEEERTEVRLAFRGVDAQTLSKLGDTFHVDVKFLVSEEDNALKIPIGALFKSGNEWAVYEMKKGRAQMREIRLSKMNDEEAVVTAGLKEGAEVVLFPGDRIRPGTRVR